VVDKSCSGVYGIVNLVNGKVYIGSSVDLSRREGEHFRLLRGGYHRNTYL
jgi:predicted GIY-YIG superfamily endonuclease